MQFCPHRAVIVLLMLSFLSACSHPPADNSNSADSQKLPFDREPRSTGISPSQSLIPSTTKLPEGTPIPIRLESTLSSASSHAGDIFGATIDESVVIDGQTLLVLGTSATGRVLEAKPATGSRGSSLEPGYLRIVLVSLSIGGKQVMIETSSIFAKGSFREVGTTSVAGQKDKDIVFSIGRRLNFRLAQTVDLQ